MEAGRYSLSLLIQFKEFVQDFRKEYAVSVVQCKLSDSVLMGMEASMCIWRISLIFTKDCFASESRRFEYGIFKIATWALEKICFVSFSMSFKWGPIPIVQIYWKDDLFSLSKLIQIWHGSVHHISKAQKFALWKKVFLERDIRELCEIGSSECAMTLFHLISNFYYGTQLFHPWIWFDKHVSLIYSETCLLCWALTRYVSRYS